MTVKEFYEFVLIEARKVSTSTIYLEDFNYYLNKAITELINKKYAVYDTSQQLTDDLHNLVESVTYTLEYTAGDAHRYTDTCKFTSKGGSPGLANDLVSNVYNIDLDKEDGCIVELPTNYLHLLSCIVTFKTVTPGYKGKVEGSLETIPAKRLTADMDPTIESNAFLKPFFTRPYFYIRNNVPKTGSLTTDADGPLIEIRAGRLNPYFQIKSVNFTYLRVPTKLELTNAERDAMGSGTLKMEFPDYICTGLIKMVVSYILENNSDARLQSFMAINPDITTRPSTAVGTQDVSSGNRK